MAVGGCSWDVWWRICRVELGLKYQKHTENYGTLSLYKGYIFVMVFRQYNLAIWQYVQRRAKKLPLLFKAFVAREESDIKIGYLETIFRPWHGGNGRESEWRNQWHVKILLNERNARSDRDDSARCHEDKRYYTLPKRVLKGVILLNLIPTATMLVTD